MGTIGQQVEHCLDTKKGWFDMASLDFAGKLDEDVEFDVPGGRVVHVHEVSHDADVGVGGGGQKPRPTFRPGCHNTGPALFVWSGSSDLNVSNPGNTASGRFVHRAISPAGNMNTLVSLGGYELETTEFDDDQTYLPNQLLTAPQGYLAAASATAGVLTNRRPGGAGAVRQFTDPVCGIVSTGEHTNHHGVQTLAFWCAWLPGAV